MKRLRRLPRTVEQDVGYFPGKLRSDYRMRKHRGKGHGVPRKQTVTLAKAGGC
jgi:hypothetical protein